MILVLIVVVSEDIEMTGPIDLSEKIIQGLTSSDNVDVVGIGSSIPRVVAGVDYSRRIANVNIQSISIDYFTIVGKQEAIFFELSQKDEQIPDVISEFERQGDVVKAEQTIWVSRRDRIPSITHLLLQKLNRYPTIKIAGSGFAITIAIRGVLQVTTTGISRKPIGITGIRIDSIPRRADSKKRVAAIQIYLKIGEKTMYPQRHESIKEQVVSR